MENPFVTVVILTRGDAPSVVADLQNQTYKNFEILFAREKGIVKAMNLALDRAKGSIFVRVDDDVKIPPQWLEELIKPFKNLEIAGVTGPTFVPKERRKNRDSIRWAENPNWFLKWLYDNDPFARAMIYKCGNVSYGSNFEEHVNVNNCYHEPDHLEGTNWAMRTFYIRLAGGFDPTFDGVAEWFDTDVEQKIKKFGFKLCYNQAAYLYHLLEKGDHYEERFEGFGRIDNWITYHRRHSRFHWKMIVFLIVWSGYFIWKGIKNAKG